MKNMKANIFETEEVDKWECPSETGIPLITMPNIPKPLHGPGCQPRTIYGRTAWDVLRKKTYFDADYKCEICGCEPGKGKLHAHELYTIDYKEGTSRFERAIAICKKCHDAIHSGRLITMYKKGNPLYPKGYVLEVVENCFKLVHEYNEKNESKIKLFDTYLEYLSVPSIASEMETLIDKYDIGFYSATRHGARWGDWKLMIGEKEYKTPYADMAEWAEKMEEVGKNDTARNLKDPFSGGVLDKIDEIFNLTD